MLMLILFILEFFIEIHERRLSLSKKRKRLQNSAVTATIIGCCLFIIVIWMQF